MTDYASLYLKYIGINLRSQMEYKASFIMMTTGSFVVSAVEFLTIAVLFSRFDSIRGWQLEEVAMFYGLINISFALSEVFDRGFDLFAQQVITGDFDRILLRPRLTGFQVLTNEFPLFRTGRLFQGIAILVWASVNIGIAWSPAKVALLAVAIIGGTVVFVGLIIIQATICFWSTQSIELMNSFTYGGVEATQWPLPIFKRWFTGFFVFFIPIACASYFPLLAIMEKPDALHSPTWFQWISPLAGFIFLLVSLAIWRIGVRHYRSTGS